MPETVRPDGATFRLLGGEAVCQIVRHLPWHAHCPDLRLDVQPTLWQFVRHRSRHAPCPDLRPLARPTLWQLVRHLSRHAPCPDLQRLPDERRLHRLLRGALPGNKSRVRSRCEKAVSSFPLALVFSRCAGLSPSRLIAVADGSNPNMYRVDFVGTCATVSA